MRNNARTTFFNNSLEYSSLFKKRKVQGIVQYGTPTVENIPEDAYEYLSFVEHVWKTGDRLSKLADKFYNEVNYWWIIGLFNEKPTDFHFKPGDVVLIPLPLTKVLSLIEYS